MRVQELTSGAWQLSKKAGLLIVFEKNNSLTEAHENMYRPTSTGVIGTGR